MTHKHSIECAEVLDALNWGNERDKRSTQKSGELHISRRFMKHYGVE